MRSAPLAWNLTGRRVGRASRGARLAAAAMSLATGCGDALLPADYAGPPAAEIGGSVVRSDDSQHLEAKSPRLALVWLTSLEEAAASSPLFVQPVSFSRSQELRKDWDIGLSTPAEAAKLTLDIGPATTSRPRMAIGKMVYFDDRDGNGVFGFPCTSAACDLVKAVSHEFVVYLDQPLTCQSDGPVGALSKVRLTRGFHHFEWDGHTMLEAPPGGDLRFMLQPGAGWPDAAATLQDFARQMVRTYRIGALTGC